MSRKRITQVFPGLLSLRRKQRIACFYLGMRLDAKQYAAKKSDVLLPHLVFASACPMYNPDTGFDMVYQENKVFNVKLAASQLEGALIRPGETFSFWKYVHAADKHIPYKNALAELNGEMQPVYGGGLCQLSNVIFWLFLHAPLTILERHGHDKKDFPEPPSDALLGVDATVYEGWLDLKVRNDTSNTYQLGFSFSQTEICASLYCDVRPGADIRVSNENLVYRQEKGGIFEEADVVQTCMERETGKLLFARKLYRNRCRIGYPLPEHTVMLEEKDD